MTYKVVVDHEACEKCGLGKWWSVEGPDDALVGISFDDESAAHEYAAALSRAYALGREASV